VKKFIAGLLALAILLPFMLHANASEMTVSLIQAVPPTAGQNTTIMPDRLSSVGNTFVISYAPTSHASAFTRHNLRGQYNQLSMTIYPDDNTIDTIISFYGDGRLLHTIEFSARGRIAWDVTVNVTGVRQLEIRARITQRAQTGDSWAMLYILRPRLSTEPYPIAERGHTLTPWQEMRSIPWQMLHAGARPSGIALFLQAFRHDVMRRGSYH